jgi:hypothetical protein
MTSTERIYSYFPGCTLATTAVEYDASGRAVAAALDLELRELPGWNCCGASFPLSAENVMNFIAPARALIASQQSGHDMATLCAVCFHALKRSDSFLRTHPEAADRLNAFVTEGDYDGRVHVRHLLGILRDDVGWDVVRRRVVAPLQGLRAAPYYGCLLLRRIRDGLDKPEAHIARLTQSRCRAGRIHSRLVLWIDALISAPGQPAPVRAVIESACAAGRDRGAACPVQVQLDRRMDCLAERLPVAYYASHAAAFGLAEHAGPAIPLQAAP